MRVGLGAAIRFTSMGPRASILMHYDMSFSKVGARLRNDTLFSKIIQNCRVIEFGCCDTWVTRGGTRASTYGRIWALGHDFKAIMLLVWF